jgi:HEAT repeat protein
MLDHDRLRKQINSLNSSSESVRRDTLLALKAHEGPEWENVPQDIIRSLVTALQHQLTKSQESTAKPPPLRLETVAVLGNVGPRAASAVPQIVELLADGVPDNLREAVAVALGKIGKDSRVAVEPLLHILQSHCRNGLADRVARSLGDIGCADQRVRTALTQLWLNPIHSQSNQVQIAITLCKLKIDAQGLVKCLTGTLVANRDSSLRKAAAEALAWCNKNDIDVVPALTVALHDDDEEVRRLAGAALNRLRVSEEKAVQICGTQLKDSTLAETALRKSGAVGVPALIEALKAKECIAREKASRTLGFIGEVAAPAVPALTATLRDKNPDIRLAAAKGLWNIAKNADLVVPVLTDLLGRKEYPEPDTPDIRRMFIQSVIEALCRIGPPAQKAISALNRKAKDENRLIRESAQRAIRTIAPETAQVSVR